MLSAKIDCCSIISIKTGIKDTDVLNIALKEGRILITNDKDFGELIYKKKLPHSGLILLRLDEDTASNRIIIVKNIIDKFGEGIKDKFIEASEKGLRIR